MIHIDQTISRDEWLAQRMSGIGASESAAVMGVNPYKTRYELWAEKCGLIQPPDLSDNEAVEFGCRLERPIADAFAERTGRDVAMWPQYQIVRDPLRNWLTCTPDAIQSDAARGEGLLQIKTTSAWNAREWADEPPLHYQIQVQHELCVTGYDWASLVVLIGGQRLRYVDVERNDRFIEAMIPYLERFWELVETRTPPEIDGSPATARALSALHPEDTGETVVLPNEAATWTADIETLKAEIKELEKRKSERENAIKAALGDAAYGVLPDGTRWSWKTQTRKAYEVAESTCRVLRRCK